MISFLPWLWAGLIIGVSFIATPAKFLTTTSSLHQLLEIGQVTFGTFMYVEITLILLLSISVIKSERVLLIYKALLVSVALIIFFQYVYLLPKLDERVDKLAQGLSIAPSNLHWLYVLAEFSKFILLIALGTIAHKRTRQINPHATT